MPGLVGARVPRAEDPRLLRGQGCFVGDLQPAGLLHLAFVRSPHAHATIRRLDLGAARAMPGVVAAVEDALAPFDVRLRDLPVRTEHLVRSSSRQALG